MTESDRPRIKIGGKSYNSLDDLPPETRQKLEQMLGQMRASGALEDKNRDGVPDRFESSLKVLGWVGKLIGKPQLRDQLARQIQDQLRALGATPPSAPPTAPAAPPAGRASTSAPPRTRTTTPGTVSTSKPASVRSGDDPHTESTTAEFIRKLVIVSVLVGLGYLAFRLLG